MKRKLILPCYVVLSVLCLSLGIYWVHTDMENRKLRAETIILAIQESYAPQYPDCYAGTYIDDYNYAHVMLTIHAAQADIDRVQALGPELRVHTGAAYSYQELEEIYDLADQWINQYIPVKTQLGCISSFEILVQKNRIHFGYLENYDYETVLESINQFKSKGYDPNPFLIEYYLDPEMNDNTGPGL